MSEAQAFLFADLAGFTALTEAHGDRHAADLVDEFSAQAGALLPHYGGEHIKTIGDALMLRVPSVARAIKLGVELVSDIMPGHGYPEIRVGMHFGPALQRGGDWFGATVNLAARISALAAGGEVLLSEATRDAAGELEGVQLQNRGTRRLRNVPQPVHLFAAVPLGQRRENVPIDPVCRMAVDADRSAPSRRRACPRHTDAATPRGTRPCGEHVALADFRQKTTCCPESTAEHRLTLHLARGT